MMLEIRDLKRHDIWQVSWGWMVGACMGVSVLCGPGAAWAVTW
jgi:hypothetical protein